MSTENKINGKHTAVGHEVHFIDHKGRKHKAKITHLEGPHAHLEAVVDGSTQHFERVPHKTDNTTYSWNHID